MLAYTAQLVRDTELRELQGGVRKLKSEGSKPDAQFEEPRDHTKLDEDGKMEVDEEACSRKKMEAMKNA